MTGAARKLLVVLGLLALLGGLVAVAQAAKDETTLISRQSAADGGAGGDDTSNAVSVSDDGRYVTFESAADNLSTIDGTANDVFLRDTQTNTTTFLSRQTVADGGAGGNGGSQEPSISNDGRYVAFESTADNLSTLDNNAVRNILVRDTQTDAITLISRQSTGDGGAGADGDSVFPVISADGRYVAFETVANNLSGSDDDTIDNVFLRDTQTNTTTLVSRQSVGDGGAGASGGFSARASISANGRYVAFESLADNLSADDDNDPRNVFVRDTQTNTTTLVSRQSSGDGGAGGDDNATTPAISGDGRYVAFDSLADNLSTEDDNDQSNVFVRDTQTNTTTLASRQSTADGGAAGDDDSNNKSSEALSSDGRYLSMESYATNFSSIDSDSPKDIFVRDLQAGTTTLVSRQSAAAGGAGGDDESVDASVTSDGRFVAFQSDADNLSTDDGNSVSNVFLRDVLGGPEVPASPSPGSPTSPSIPGVAPLPDKSVSLALGAKKKQKVGKSIAVDVSCAAEACTVVASGSINVPGTSAAKKFKLKKATKTVSAGQKAKLRLALSRKIRKAAKRALKRRKKVTAKVSVTATDATKNAATSSTRITLSG